MQKFSSFGRKKKKQTKIRHGMVMLEGLQLRVIISCQIQGHAVPCTVGSLFPTANSSGFGGEFFFVVLEIIHTHPMEGFLVSSPFPCPSLPLQNFQ